MTIVWMALALWAYSYLGYPVALLVLTWTRPRRTRPPAPATWPQISVVIPAYNEAAAIAETLEAVLAADYPAAQRQVLVISDASTDETDQIVRRFEARGVQLLRVPVRRGKTAAENAARSALHGEIIVNTDSSVRIHVAALKCLVAEFSDPTVGVASSRDVSVSRVDAASNPGEGAYVGYEMWVRDLETRLDGIIGASGSLYAIRAHLHQYALSEALSRDFAAALVARRAGFRAVSVPGAICFVPRGVSLRREYARKVRTMTRGLGTLFLMKDLLNPFRHGLFAWMLASHKLCRWLLPWATAAMVVAIAGAVWASQGRWIALAALLATGALTGLGWLWPDGARVPRLVALPTFAAAGVAAGLHAWIRLFTGRLAPTWEPTRRGH